MGIRQIIALIGVFCLFGGYWQASLTLFAIALLVTFIKALGE